MFLRAQREGTRYSEGWKGGEQQAKAEADQADATSEKQSGFLFLFVYLNADYRMLSQSECAVQGGGICGICKPARRV